MITLELVDATVAERRRGAESILREQAALNTTPSGVTCPCRSGRSAGFRKYLPRRVDPAGCCS